MLTPKQQRFVDEYLVDLNASASKLRDALEKALPNIDQREAINAVWEWWRVDHPDQQQPQRHGA